MRKTLFLLLLAISPAIAEDDRLHERFADPATRATALAELIPGTRDAYFHTALVHQLEGRTEEFDRTIAEWKAAAEREENRVSAAGLATLENRQLLMDYKNTPVKSLAGLIRHFDLDFDDARPDAASAAENLPVRLDPAAISEAAFEAAAARQSPSRPYTNYSEKRLLRELDRLENFDEAKIRWFLENLDRADLPGVVPLVDRALGIDDNLSFREIPLLAKLTSAQLETLLELHPGLRAKESFALSYLAKIRPGAETDFQRDRAAHAAHLARCRDFALELPPALNSLKAHVLFHHLRIQRELGNFPKDDFLAFLALPRPPHPLLLEREPSTAPTIDLGADFRSVSGCPPVREDLVLIEAYLRHFLAFVDSAAEFAPFIGEKELARHHARARLLAGADPAVWGAMLAPEEFKELQEETRVGFAPGTPDLYAADDAVSLVLDLKNTPELLVRIYELDLPAHLSTRTTGPDVGIDLDGLVPHHERRIAFELAPIVAHRGAIDLPELAGPGAWLVEFTAGQVSARALVRKGRLITYPARTADGQTVRVFDENGASVPDASIALGRESFTADASGVITIPNSPHQPVTRGIVRAGKLAEPISLGSRDENIELDAQFHLEREHLLAGREARLFIRLRLTNHGAEIPLDRIKEPALVLKAEMMGDVSTERVIADGLKLAPVMEVPFQVPSDLLKLTLTLRGSIPDTIGDGSRSLEKETVYQTNAGLKSARIGTAYFSPVAGGHRLEVRGRNGEPLPSRAITLECHRYDYETHVKVEVRTDEFGRVDLGNLDTIDWLTASGTGIAEALYGPNFRELEYASNLHLAADQAVRVPLEKPTEVPDRLEISLLEMIDDAPVRDHFDKLFIDARQLVVRGLPPGDFLLVQGDNTTRISVSSGEMNGGLLVSPVRILAAHSPLLTSIDSVMVTDDVIVVRLRDFGPESRVTVIGRRYQFEEWSPGDALYPFSPPLADTLKPGFTGNGFLTDRRLSDETRYILDRRAALKFPGVMLPRPGPLLHRWTSDDLDQGLLTGRGGADGRSSGAQKKERSDGIPPRLRRLESSGSELEAACDFLANTSLVRWELTPDADGRVRLPLDEFTGSQFLEITATDADASDRFRVALPATETPLRDRRLARPFDPETHLLATRNATVLAKGEEVKIESLLDADWRAFTTLSEVRDFLYGVTADGRLQDFAFLSRWPELAPEKKLELLSQHACHEFHLFLARKDKVFFDQHVKPLLEAKPEPQFMDDLLLERDLSAYLSPYAWNRLNAAEKALLARAMPAARERIRRELTLRWDLEAPAPDGEEALFTQTLKGEVLNLSENFFGASQDTHGVAYLTSKLDRIIIPRIDFENTSLEEAIDFLRLRATELDVTELDPSKKGINFVVGGSDSLPRIKGLQLRNVPMGQALKYIAEQTKMRYRVDDFAVTLESQTESREDLFTRSFRIPTGFFERHGAHGAFPEIQVLGELGVSFPEGSSARTADGALVVTNTPGQLEKIEQLFLTSDNAPLQISPALEDSSLIVPLSDEDGVLPPLPILDEPAADSFAKVDPFSAPKPALQLAKRMNFPERTRLWREANYYRHAGATDESLVPLNRFWLDLAAWDGEGPFLSPHFNECQHNANEALLCLALLDLPFKAERPEVIADGGALTVKANEAMLLFYKDTRATDQVAEESPLLVRQSFSPLGEAFVTVDGRQVENPVTGDFRPGVPYRTSLVVTNPAGIGRRIDVLAQIPAGAIPLAGLPATLSSTHELQPYGVLMLSLNFYFPAAGEFAVYPLHVSEDGTVLAHSGQRRLRVTEEPAPPDAASWLVLAKDGSSEQVLERLRVENLKTLDLAAIRWRLHDRAFFAAASGILRERLHFSPYVSSYALLHDDPAEVRNLLENSKIVRDLGQWLDSPLLDVRPRFHLNWESLEFDPLVNPRAHRFAGASRLTHAAAADHYRAFLSQLAWKPALDSSDQMSWTILLLLQDRVEEALARFDRIDPAEIRGRLNYDYLHAVVNFHRGQPEAAREIAAAALPSLPPGLWRERFQAVADQAAEIVALSQPPADDAPEEKPAAPELALALAADGNLLVRHRALESASLRLFSVDLEVLFSKDPFLTGGNNTQPSIRPNASLVVPLDAGKNETAIELPAVMRAGNLLVSAEAGPRELLVVPDSRALELRHLPLERTVQVIDPASRRPLSRTYIKVYAETRSGEVLYHKDGYTDLRGKFDYVSHTGVDVSDFKRFAILASDPEKGARTVIYER